MYSTLEIEGKKEIDSNKLCFNRGSEKGKLGGGNYPSKKLRVLGETSGMSNSSF